MSITPPPVITASAAPSAIADVTYRNYDGELRTRALRWWIITVATLRANVNRKKYGFWIPAIIILLIYLFQGIFFYASKGFQDRMQSMGALLGDQPDAYTLTLYSCLTGSGFFLAVAAMTIGSAVIAADNRANALLVYLSKPLTRTDYLIGKWMGIFLLLACLTVIPSLVLFLFFVVAYSDQNFLKDHPTLILRLLAATLIPAVIHTSLIVGISAWSKTARIAGVVFAALYIVTATIAGQMNRVLLSQDREGKSARTTAIVSHLSIEGVNDGIAMNLYQVPPPTETKQQMQDQSKRRANWERRREGKAPLPPEPKPEKPELIPTERPDLAILLLIGGVLTVIPIAAAYMKVRAVEVVRG